MVPPRPNTTKHTHIVTHLNTCNSLQPLLFTFSLHVKFPYTNTRLLGFLFFAGWGNDGCGLHSGDCETTDPLCNQTFLSVCVGWPARVLSSGCLPSFDLKCLSCRTETVLLLTSPLSETICHTRLSLRHGQGFGSLPVTVEFFAFASWPVQSG